MPLFSARAASSFGFADLYSQDPGLQLERYPESFVSVYLFLVVYCIIFRCYVFKCNLNLWYFCVIFICLYSVYSCNLMHCCNIQWNVLLYAFCCGLFSNYPTLSFTGKLRVFTVGIRALVYKAQRTRHIRTIRKNSSDIGLVISN